MKISIKIIVILILAGNSKGMTQSIDEVLANYFNDFKNNKLNISALTAISNYQNKSTLLSNFDRYTTDSLSEVRSEAFRLIVNLMDTKDAQSTNSLYLNYLLRGTVDKSEQVNRIVLNKLFDYPPIHFSSGYIGKVYAATKHATDKSLYIKFIGYTGGTSYLDSLKDTQFSAMTEKEKWALLLAQARLGDSISIDRIVKQLDVKAGSCDQLVAMLPDFSYVKSRKVIDKLLMLSMSDERLCRAPNPSSNLMISAGYYIIPYLSYSISLFPIEVDESGEMFDDYEDAMRKLKDWYSANSKTYRINIYSYR